MKASVRSSRNAELEDIFPGCDDPNDENEPDRPNYGGGDRDTPMRQVSGIGDGTAASVVSDIVRKSPVISSKAISIGVSIA